MLSKKFELGQLNRVHDLERQPGGKGINIAMMLGVMGAEVIATGFLGRAVSQFVQETLHRNHVTTNFVHINEPTRHNYFIIDEASGTRTLLDEEGPRVENEELSYFIDNYTRLLKRCSMIVLAGSIPRMEEQNIYCRLMDIANEAEVPVVINTQEEFLVKCIEKQPFLIMPDMRSTDYLLGEKIDEDLGYKKSVCQILSKGQSMAILTFDNENYIVTTKNGCFEAVAPQVDVRSRLKTGDGMIAGVIYGLNKGYTEKEAIKYGVALSTAASTYRVRFIQNKEEVEELVDKVIIKEV